MNLSIKIRRVISSNRLLFYLIGFVVVLSLVQLITDSGLRKIDSVIYRTFYFNEDTENNDLSDLILIDMPEIDIDTMSYRDRLAVLLDTIKLRSDNVPITDKPKVVLDFSFSKKSAEENKALINSIERLHSSGLNVYGVYDVVYENDSLNWEFNEKDRDSYLYDSFPEGKTHTQVKIDDSGIIWYDSYLEFWDKLGVTHYVTALPLKVAKPDINFEFKNLETYVLPYGGQDRLNSRTWRYEFKSDGGNHRYLVNNNQDEILTFSNKKKIIIGDFANDTVRVRKKILYGPNLVAWALLDQLKPDNEKLSKQPINNPLLQFIIVLSGVLAILVIFNLIFKQFKKFQTRLILLTALSFLFGLIILFIIVYFITPENRIIRPSFPALSMFLTSIFIWQYKKIYIKRGLVEGNKTYDVFISYSRSQTKWVKNNLYHSLKGFRNSEDKKINIFFDEESIPEGELFHSYYRDAIINSKLFLPIFSEDYFNKNHCMEELKLALFRVTETNGSENELKIYPLAFNIDKVPAQYRDRNITLIDDENTFLKKLKETLYKS